MSFTEFLDFKAQIQITPATTEVKETITKVFEKYSKKKSGFLSKFEYKLCYLSIFGHEPTKFCVQTLFEEFPLVFQDNEENVPTSSNPDVFISKSAFLKNILQRIEQTDKMDRARDLFLVLDKKKKGYLLRNDIDSALDWIQSKENTELSVMSKQMIIPTETLKMKMMALLKRQPGNLPSSTSSTLDDDEMKVSLEQFVKQIAPLC